MWCVVMCVVWEAAAAGEVDARGLRGARAMWGVWRACLEVPSGLLQGRGCQLEFPGVDALSPSLVPEDVPLCGSAHDTQPLHPLPVVCHDDHKTHRHSSHYRVWISGNLLGLTGCKGGGLCVSPLSV